MIVATGFASYDRLKASRITLLHALVIWTLGRLLLANNAAIPPTFSVKIEELGLALGRSKLLFKESDWDWQLLPDMLFRPGHNWQDA